MTKDLEAVVEEIRKLPNREDCLEKVYQILTSKYHGNKIKTYSRFFEIFSNGIGDLWSRTGFIHCTNVNLLAKNMLVSSGHFKNKDIQFRWTLIYWISPHQYMRVRISDDEYVNVDIWAKVYGIEFGDYAHGFNL